MLLLLVIFILNVAQSIAHRSLLSATRVLVTEITLSLEVEL